MKLKNKRFFLLILCVILFSTSLSHARIYSGINKGVVWNDLGGVEFVGDPGLFICPGNLLEEVLPQFVVDC